MAWATVEQVESITGVEVTEAQLAQAQGVVEVFVDREYDEEVTYRASDERRLRAAVAWQAAFIAGQVDIPGRASYSSYDQGGSGGTGGLAVSLPDQASVVLAPLARRSILNLSWKRSRTIQTPTPAKRRYTLANFMQEQSDDSDGFAWRPL